MVQFNGPKLTDPHDYVNRNRTIHARCANSHQVLTCEGEMAGDSESQAQGDVAASD